MSKEKPTKSYILSPEALEAIDKLDEKIKDKGRSQIVSEALVQMALVHGIKIKGRKADSTLEELEKRTEALEELVKALCKTCVKSEYEACEEEPDYGAVDELVSKALGKGVKPEPRALFREVKKELPEALQHITTFTLYLGVRNLPSK